MPVAVVRAENYYVPPAPLPRDAWAAVPAAELVFAWFEYQMGRRVEAPAETLNDEPALFARVDSNRWIAECVCGSAAVVSPADPRWACTTCGYGWVALIVPSPSEVAAIEAELLKQPRPNRRSWWNPTDPMNPDRPTDAPSSPTEPTKAGQETKR
ncbi:hypothetical protein [Streptomyces sp. NPDC056105]|uniref:hypothetical protein n=1 Tax=Streptomyces sp. NPDC056105 TaxID=3345714 RepID=UPI0035D6855A